MNIEFGNNRLAKQMGSATEIKKAFGLMAFKVAQRLQEIRDAPNLSILMEIPAAGCHPLKGNKEGDWALTISVNHRMVFIVVQNPLPRKENNELDLELITNIRILRTEDYHKR